MSSSDFNADFRVLGLAPTENWSKVKSAYRKLARKWHPDRYTDSGTEKNKAEEKLKDINLAYTRLSNYYKKHSRLPPIKKIVKPDIPENRENQKKQNVKKSYPKPQSEPDSGRDENHNPRSEATDQPWKVRKIVFVIIIASLILFLSDKEIILQTNKIPRDAGAVTSQPLPDAHRPLPAIRYFTYDSTLGEVHSVQGVPTKIEGDIWFYGKSEVRFKKGRVISWLIDPNTPLMASAIKISSKKLFGYGSTVNDVLLAQGRPSLMAPNIWEYGLSKVYFQNGAVIRWYSSPTDPLNITKSFLNKRLTRTLPKQHNLNSIKHNY